MSYVWLVLIFLLVWYLADPRGHSPIALWRRWRPTPDPPPEQAVVTDTVSGLGVSDNRRGGDVDQGREVAPGVVVGPGHFEALPEEPDLTTLTKPERLAWLRHADIPQPGEQRTQWVEATALILDVTPRTLWRDLEELGDQK